MGLSGVQRITKFVKYLPDFGWKPTVLTVEPGGYFAFDPELEKEVQSSDIRIVRTQVWIRRAYLRESLRFLYLQNLLENGCPALARRCLFQIIK